MVIFGQSRCVRAKWLYSAKSGYIRAKVVVFLRVGCIRANWLYSGKIVVFGQKWLYSGKVVNSGKLIVFG